jgi:hypothetical protein
MKLGLDRKGGVLLAGVDGGEYTEQFACGTRLVDIGKAHQTSF